MKFFCRCSKIQQYTCQVCAKPFFSPKKFICFDKCLVNELFWLWDQKIETIESCCGHYRNNPYIAVVDIAIPKMLVLNYQQQVHGPNFFCPKTNFPQIKN